MLSLEAAKKSLIPMSLHDAISEEQWRLDVQCYLYTVVGLASVTASSYEKVRECLKALSERLKPAEENTFGVTTLYLEGVYSQTTGNFKEALRIFESPSFSSETLALAATSLADVGMQVRVELSILAALNRLLIMRKPEFRDDQRTSELAELMRRICPAHPDPNIKVAYHIVRATIETNPPTSIKDVKESLNDGLKIVQATNNTICKGILLSVMRSRLFENVVGDQAMKSAKAAAAQSMRSGNLLWMSVAGAMLSQALEVQGQPAEEQRKDAIGHLNEWWLLLGVVPRPGGWIHPGAGRS